MLLKINWEDFFGIGFWQSALVALITLPLGYYISWYKRNTFFIAVYLRKFKYFFIRAKYVLVWNDHTIDLSEKIADLLKDKGIKYKFKLLIEPDELLKYPLSPKYIQTIILIVTDVTKLSESEPKRNRIQLKLVNYVRKGGILFGTHDLIYRRCRNKTLQQAFGCETYNFLRVQTPISAEIILVYKNHPLLRGIDLKPIFHDGEVCYGEWNNDAMILIQTVDNYPFADNNKVPLLAIRHTGSCGTLIWLNSADKSDEVAKSLSEPYKEVIRLMYNAIVYSKEIKEFYKSKIGHVDAIENKTTANMMLPQAGHDNTNQTDGSN